MPSHPIIALDAMGGDIGPNIVVPAAEQARLLHPQVRFQFYGNKAEIEPLLAQFPKLQAASTIIHTDEVVLGTDKPSQALRRSRTSSMGLAISAVKDGKAHAAVSAGNTGAMMAIAKFALRTMSGIDRPALASLLPTVRAECVMLDLGANTECSADNLVEFAVMGAAFARTVLGLKKPKVALLNIGVEEMKGTEALRDAANRLRESKDLALEFVGFVEGDKIGSGDVDVVVTDGFSGNIALKTAEGTAKLVASLLRQAFQASLWTKIGYLFSRTALSSLRNHLDPNNHNGAVFLGLNGLVVKSHGGASAAGFANAIGVALDLIADNLGGRIADDIETVHVNTPTTAVLAQAL